MNDYKSAFNSMAADIGAIIALLGFDRYPGVDPVLRAITDLVLAKAETEGLRAERDVALAAVAQLHSMLGVTDQVQAGERLGFLVGQSIMVPKLESKLAALERQEPVAEVVESGGTLTAVIARHSYATKLPVGTKLYAAPVAQAGQVPEGWKLVPIEPTEWPLEAGVKAYNAAVKYGCEQIDCIYDALHEMLAAAPAQGGE